MKKYISTKGLLLLPISVCLYSGMGSASLATEVIYRETFGSNAGLSSYATPSDYGWQALRASVGQPNILDASASLGGASISGQAGTPGDLGNINTGTISSSTTNGFMAYGTGTNDNGKYSGLIYTQQFEFEADHWSIDSISWYASAGPTSAVGYQPAMRVALQYGSQWYVSEQIDITVRSTFNSNDRFTSTATLYSLDMDSALWYTLTADVGSPFSIASTSSTLPEGGGLTGFGLYLLPNLGSNSQRVGFDTFTISATSIPEPSVVGLFAGGPAVMLLSRWIGARRRRA